MVTRVGSKPANRLTQGTELTIEPPCCSRAQLINEKLETWIGQIQGCTKTTVAYGGFRAQ